MNEKRFTYEYDEYNGNLFDNEFGTFYHIEDSDENIKILCDRLNWLVEENEKLKSQLYCPFDSICIQCNNEYLVQTEKYYISKCKKGYEQCSKVDVKYCDDFELKGDVE